MDTPLVICIGNVARGDDGVAHAVGALLGSAQARVVLATDLDVAMAEDVAEASVLVIVDAQRRIAPAVEVEPLAPGPAGAPTGHAIDAPSLLALAQALYGHAPRALLVSVAAPEMGHGEGLSDTARAASEEAAREVLRLTAGR